MRRTIAGLTSKNYNRLFISWIGEFRDSGAFSYAALQAVINAADNDTSRLPTDDEVKRGFRETFLYNKNAREVLFFIALHQLDNSRFKDTRRTLLPVTAYSVEHIMPKKWPEHWNQPKLGETAKDERNWWLKRMGNLTLITGNMNSKLRNSSWSKKRKTLAQYSDLSITVDYLGEEIWNEEQIVKRSEELAETGLAIW